MGEIPGGNFLFWGVSNALEKSKEASGSAGFMLALCMLIAGIIALISKLSKRMTRQ